MAERRDVAVVGAGITGLTTAFHLARGGLDVVLLEAAERVGGVIESRAVERPEGTWRFETGPNTVLESRPEVPRLIHDAGLTAPRVEADPAAQKRYVWKGDRLVPLPGGAASFLTTPLFSATAKLRLLAEPFIGKREDGREESIAEFVRRRLGPELLEYAVGPFVSGVYAGDPERLSVRWAVSRIHALEEEHGSLIRGMFARMKQRRKHRVAARGGGPAGPGGAMITFRDGLHVLPRGLAVAIAERGGSVHTDTAVRRLAVDGDGFVLETDGGTLSARRAVLTVPSDVTAALLDDATAGAARPFADVPYAPVVVATVGVRRSDVAHPLDGFGFLAPRGESLRVLGCLFTSSFFPGRAPEGWAALTSFAGGRTDPQAVELPEDALRELFLGDLERAVGLSGTPAYLDFRRWRRAIPQYEVGHGRYADLAAEIERDLPGLTLAGNYLDGVSVPDRIQRGTRVAEEILHHEAAGAAT